MSETPLQDTATSAAEELGAPQKLVASTAAIVTVENDELWTDSQSIAGGMELEHESVLRLIREHRADFEEFGICRFEIRMAARAQGGGRPPEIAVLNEPQATLLCTYFRNSSRARLFKKGLIKAFFEMRKKLRAKSAPVSAIEMLNDPSSLRLLLSGYADRALQLETDIAASAPAVQFHTAVAAAANCQTVGEFAKVLGTGEIRFFRWLRAERLLMANNLPFQRFADRGVFRVVERVWRDRNNEPRTTAQTLITGKGALYLQKRWSSKGTDVASGAEKGAGS